MRSQVRVGVGVMLLRNNQVLLGKRHDDPTKADSDLHGEGTWTMPGGKVDFGEKLQEAACREILEETGIQVSPQNLKMVSVTNDQVDDAHFVTLGFLCESFGGEAEVREPDEITTWQWFPIDQLPQPLFSCSEKLLHNYLDNKVYQD